MRTIHSAAIVIGGMASALPSCGARSSPGELDELYSLGTVATQVGETTIAIDEGKSARENVPLPTTVAPPIATTPVVPPAPVVTPEPPVTPPAPIDPPVAPVDPDPGLPPDVPDPMIEPVPDTPMPPVDGDSPHLWLYLDTTSASLINLVDESERFALPSVDPGDEMLKPWSRDGRFLTYVQDTTLYFLDLATGETLWAQDTAIDTIVHGWVEGLGAFVSYPDDSAPVSFIVSPDGNVTLLGETSERAPAAQASCSPAGNAILYSTSSEPEGRVYWVPLLNGIEAGVELLSAAGDLMTRVHWSADGGWAVFSDAPEGNFLAVADGDAETIGTVGAVSDMLEFAPTGNSLVNTESSGISWVELLGPGSFRTTVVDGAVTGTAAHFSADGARLYHQSGPSSGLLRDIGGGMLAPGYALEGFASECPLIWTGADRFLYQQCGTELRGLVEGVLTGGEPTFTVLNESLLDNLSFGPARRCFVNWESMQLDVGSTELPLMTEFTRVAAGEVTFATLSPNDAAVAWVEGGDEVYWLPLNGDCTVSTLPISVSNGEAVQQLAFIAEWP